MDSNTKDVTKIEMTLIKMRSTMFRRMGDDFRKEFSVSTPIVVKILAEHYGSNSGPITVTELAEKMSLTPAAISQILNPLEKHRLICRKKSPQDKRHTYIVLTLKGKLMLKHIEGHYKNSKILDEVLNYLGEKDAAEFVRLFGRVDDFLSQRESAEKEKANA